MSWLQNLYKTYESNLSRVGVIEKKYNDKEFTLLPISHTTQNAHIEVTITENGEFHLATVIDNKDASTLIPCTEASASRAGSKIAPYPLHDKLSYVAGDFVSFGGKMKKEEPFTHYIKQLENWVNSPYANNKIKSIYHYLSKRQLIEDLVESKIIFLDKNGQLIGKWDKNAEEFYGDKPELFRVITGDQESAFIRFNVYSPTTVQTAVWKDKDVFNSFINYYNDLLGDNEYCFVTGEVLPSTDKHANKIRNAADKAKLISANDTSGFTFRGRFNNSKEVASISYEVSQKAHNALKWLINRQAKMIDQRVFLVWGNEKLEIPEVTEDSFTFFSKKGSTKEVKSDTDKVYARNIAKAIDSYKSDLSPNSKVNILILDSATTGRLAVLYYRNMVEEQYLEKLKNWHSTCVWLHKYRKNEDGKFVEFIGAPATKDIAFAAYGPTANEKVVKGLMTRLLPCIIDGVNIPLDIIRIAISRASNPVGLERWEWEKTLSITCALINKQEEGYDVPLDKENNNRDYLFGRLLAIADVLERSALDSKENRATNAIRYMNSFSRHPERTWKTIQSSIQPYQAKLGGKAIYYSRLIDEVASRFNIEDFNNKPLSGKYLLGFYSQRHDLYQKKEIRNEKVENKQINEVEEQ